MVDVTNLLKTFGKTLNDNAPALLTVFAVGGVVTTTVLAVKATPQVLREIDDFHYNHPDTELTKLEVCKVAWRPYAPAVAMGGATIAAIIASNRVSSKRAGALAAAYSLTERAYHEYKEGVVDEVGTKTEEKIRARVAEKRLEREPIGDKEVIIAENEQLFYDMYSGRSFKSTVETVRSAMNDINALINNASYASLNDFYRKIGLAATTAGEEVGFDGDHMLDISFATILTAGVPCISIDYTVPPVANYHKIW